MRCTPDLARSSSALANAIRIVGKPSLTPLAGALLLSISTAQPGWAATPDPDLSIGTYRSSEGATRTPAQLGEALSIPLLPDPAAALATRHKSGDLQTDLYSDDWYLQEAWITDIGLLLYNDADNDGYFAGFSLSVDADSSYSDADVYLSIDIQRPFHRVENLHTSNVFPVYGQSAADEYRIDIELINNYPPDHYDLIIELRDAYDNQTLERVTSADFSNLRALPLESEDSDSSRYEPDYGSQYPDTPIYNDDIRVDEHAGGFGWLMGMALGLSLVARRRTSATRA